jgi:hypothetical protein
VQSNRLVIALGLFVFTVSNASILLASDTKRERGLKGYDRAGPYTLSVQSHYAGAEETLASIRNFIWSHWSQKKKGYLSVTRFSLEGNRTTREFFIEPSDKESWRIRIIVTREISSFTGKPPKTTTSTLIGVSVKRIDKSGEHELAPDQEVAGGSYRLVITCRNGEEIEE